MKIRENLSRILLLSNMLTNRFGISKAINRIPRSYRIAVSWVFNQNFFEATGVHATELCKLQQNIHSQTFPFNGKQLVSDGGPGLLATVDSILKAFLLHAIRAVALRIFKSRFLLYHVFLLNEWIYCLTERYAIWQSVPLLLRFKTELALVCLLT